MRRVDWFLLLTIASFTILVAGQIACGRSGPPAPEAAATTATTSKAVPVGTVKDIMKGLVDPSSAAIWDAVGTESTKDGLVDKAPKNDEEWAVVEHNALMLAEVANLLKMPDRHMARPEEANAKSTPDAPELTPAQIEERVIKDRAAWDSKADALQLVAIKAMAAARAHDTDAVLAVGEEIDTACESCHKVYWYPDDAAGAPASATKS
jgi:hypothetical protein